MGFNKSVYKKKCGVSKDNFDQSGTTVKAVVAGELMVAKNSKNPMGHTYAFSKPPHSSY